MMHILLLIFVSLFSNGSGSFSDDLEKVVKSYGTPPECVFNHSEITSKTKKFFPKCGMVYGILVINSNTDLSLAQLKSVFKNMTTLVGGLIVENSSLSNLDFFTYPYEYLPFYCKTYGLVIRNNSKLTNGTMLLGTRFYSQNTTKECYVSIENNELLDMSSLCGQGELKDLLDIRTKGNFKNCGCQGNGPLSEFQNCNTTFNGLKLLNTTNLDLYPLSNITTIQGSIDIQNSNIQNLSFLTNWQFWTVKSNRTVILNLQNNPIMKRLGLPVLKKFEKKLRGLGLANIENLHPEFCITIAEFKFIFEVLELSFLNLDAKICNEEIGDIRDNVLCHFESMYDLPYNCDIIVGNVIVDFGDEEYFSKLFNVWHLYGTLTIRNTNLKTFNRLQLSYIAYLDDRDLEQQDRLIQIYSNPKLNDFLMNSVSNIITSGKREALIQDNHPDAFKDWETGEKTECAMFPYPYMYFKDYYSVNLNFTGGDCGQRVEIKNSNLAIFYFSFSFTVAYTLFHI